MTTEPMEWTLDEPNSCASQRRESSGLLFGRHWPGASETFGCHPEVPNGAGNYNTSRCGSSYRVRPWLTKNFSVQNAKARWSKGLCRTIHRRSPLSEVGMQANRKSRPGPGRKLDPMKGYQSEPSAARAAGSWSFTLIPNSPRNDVAEPCAFT
jgi:hypothetical protein